MALDGIYLSKIKNEIIHNALGLRVDKVNQPSKDEIILNLRGKGTNLKLFFCVRPDCSRVHFTTRSIPNPPAPPMFCMLLRKHLTGAIIKKVHQRGLDRILFIEFDAVNEIGDKVELTLCLEIMGTYSNLILIKEGRIIDAAKRIDFSASAVRQVLPGFVYVLPESQNKMNLEICEADEVVDKILSEKGKLLSRAIISDIEGVSPIVSREISYRTSMEDDEVDVVFGPFVDKLKKEIRDIKDNLDVHGQCYAVYDEKGRPVDFSYVEIRQYGEAVTLKVFNSYSELLDSFYYERDKLHSVNRRGNSLIKLVNNLIERTSRKLQLQSEDLKKCENKEQLRLFGELILANLYRLGKGVTFYEVENYYDNCNIVRIPCNPALSPTDNQKKYYKEYRKAQTAEKMLATLIESGNNELIYLESVLDELTRAETDAEVSAIRDELSSAGYLKNSKEKKYKFKFQKELPPIEYQSSDGFRILVGRNNVQNDKLSLKTAAKNDMWFHAQKTPGSHVVIFADGKEISDDAIEQAAMIAAYHSKAKNSSLVTVDYTRVKALKKPNGAKAGMVIYHEYWSILVKPEEEKVNALRVK